MSIFAIHREMVDCNQQPLLRDVHVHVYIYIERERDLNMSKNKYIVEVLQSKLPLTNVYLKITLN